MILLSDIPRDRRHGLSQSATRISGHNRDNNIFFLLPLVELIGMSGCENYGALAVGACAWDCSVNFS